MTAKEADDLCCTIYSCCNLRLYVIYTFGLRIFLEHLGLLSRPLSSALHILIFSLLNFHALLIRTLANHISPLINLIETQSQSSNPTNRKRNPSRHNNLLVRKRRTSIPDQMSNSIERVIREREREERLGREFRRYRPRTERGGYAGGLKVPSEERSGEVCGAEDVEATGEDAAGDTVEDGAEPGYLGLVDAEVGGDGTVTTLGGEEVVGFLGGDC